MICENCGHNTSTVTFNQIKNNLSLKPSDYSGVAKCNACGGVMIDKSQDDENER